MIRKLNEGLKAGDLSGLVLPIISVDEYVSKVDDDAVVVGFYVHDKNAAADLNRFIQKSPVSCLDTEVSKAPDQRGFYFVFVEFMPNDRLASDITSLLKDVEALADVEDWTMRIRGDDTIQPYDETEFMKGLKKARSSDGGKESAILEFLTPSDLDHATLAEGVLEFGTPSCSLRFQIVGFGDYAEFTTQGLNEQAEDLSIHGLLECSRLERTLGPGWSAQLVSDNFIIRSSSSPHVLVLRNQ